MIITGDEWRLIQEISGDYYGGLMVRTVVIIAGD